MFDIEPGKEEEFRYLQRSLALSDRLDRLIETTEPLGEPEQASPPTFAPIAGAADRPRGFRAAFASRLARLAFALHREATETALQPRAESQR